MKQLKKPTTKTLNERLLYAKGVGDGRCGRQREPCQRTITLLVCADKAPVSKLLFFGTLAGSIVAHGLRKDSLFSALALGALRLARHVTRERQVFKIVCSHTVFPPADRPGVLNHGQLWRLATCHLLPRTYVARRPLGGSAALGDRRVVSVSNV